MTVIIGTPCAGCGSAIGPGERVAQGVAFEGWKHARCPTDRFDVDPASVCPDCFTVRATTGACSCES